MSDINNNNSCCKISLLGRFITIPVAIIVASGLWFSANRYNANLSYKGSYYYRNDNAIQTTGKSYKEIKADEAVIQFTLIGEANNLISYESNRKVAIEKIKKFLVDSGINKEDIVGIESSHIDQLQNYINNNSYGKKVDERVDVAKGSIKKYKTYNIITVRTKNTDLAERVSAEVPSLFKDGSDIYCESKVIYKCTKLEELKLEMIEEAIKNAKNKADTVAKATGKKINKCTQCEIKDFTVKAYGDLSVRKRYYWNDDDKKNGHETAKIKCLSVKVDTKFE